MDEAVFNNDVLYMKSLVGRAVSIQTVDSQTHVGTVYVIDPVYKTVVLINRASNCLQFILSHALQSFTVLDDARNEDLLHVNGTSGFSSEELQQKKLSLQKWLKHMFLDVKEDGELLRVEDHLVIGPPYSKTECMCDNTIVLERIQNIIDLMPVDFK